jgi:hypothetical protein
VSAEGDQVCRCWRGGEDGLKDLEIGIGPSLLVSALSAHVPTFGKMVADDNDEAEVSLSSMPASTSMLGEYNGLMSVDSDQHCSLA